ncbi:MAG TPA: DciA family protein [Alphaproteobacteria bacterium]|nr:DciA family protein [Alphaproteobacteria bacterium]
MTRSGGSARSLAQLLPKLTRAVMGKRGFAEAGLLADWPAVVGQDVAAKALPERLDFPRGERSEGTLHVRVEGAWALALQHLEPQLVERINAYFGYRAVSRLKLHQGPLARRAETPPKTAPPAAEVSGAGAVDADAGLAEKLAAVENPGLRAALARFSRALRARAETSKKGG